MRALERYCCRPFPVRLHSLMQETGTTQQMLADYVGVQRQTISKYASGLNTPDIEKFEKIADFFGVSFEYLLGRTDAKQHEHAPFVDEMGLSEGAAAMLRAWRREGEQEKLDALSWIIEHEAVDTLLRFVKELNEKRATKSHRKPLSTCDMV